MVSKNTKINNLLISLFIMSIPLMPICSIYIFYILGILQVLLYLINIKKNNYKIEINFFDIAYLLLIIWNIISIKWSFTKELSLIKWMLIYFVFTLSTTHNLKIYFTTEEKKVNYDKIVEYYFKFFAIGTIIVSIICILYEKIYLGSSLRLGTFIYREPYGTRMMYTFNLEIVLFYYLYNFMNTKEKKISQFILLPFLLLCTLLTGTRKIFIGILVIIIANLIIKNKKNFFKITFKLLIILLLLITTIQLTINIKFLYNTIGYRIESAINFTEGNNKNVDASLRDRNMMIEYGIEKFKQHPLQGNGSNVFHSLFYIYYGQDLYSHNNYVELLCNLGIIGFMIYYSIYINLFLKNKNFKYKNMIICLSLALLVMDYWTVSHYRIQFLLFLGISTIYLKRDKLRR